MVTVKVSTTDMYVLAPLQVQERAAIDIALVWLSIALLWLPHRKCIVKICKDYVRHLNKNIFSKFQDCV